MLSPTDRTERARIATLTRHHGADSPDVVDLRRKFKEERIAEYIRRTVDAAPPLTPEQRDRLALLLRDGGASDAA